MAEIGMRVESFLVVADVEHGVDGSNVDELARGLIHLVHRIGKVLTRPDDDRHNLVLHQLGKHLTHGIIGVVEFFPDLDVTQVDDMKLWPVVEKRVKGFPDVVHAIGAAFVVDRTAFFLDADDGQIHTFEVGECLLVAVDAYALAQGLLTWTVGRTETLFSDGLKEDADVHFFWLMAYDYGPWLMAFPISGSAIGHEP